jgi:SAM-dependent methyltransferase
MWHHAASMADAHFENRRIYRAPTTVAAYAEQDGLTGIEEQLFEAYVREGDEVLDIGVGGGRTAGYLSGRASRYLGIDYSEPMIDACRRRFPHCEFRVMDASDLSQIEDASFDVAVFSFNGLGYIHPNERRGQCLREIGRVLKPDGILIFSLHNARSLFLRPTRAGREIHKTLVGLFLSALANIRRFGQRIVTRSFWLGSGYVRTNIHGGLAFYLASPSVVASELGAAGFRLLAIEAEDADRRPSRFVTRWYYYVARRVTRR